MHMPVKLTHPHGPPPVPLLILTLVPHTFFQVRGKLYELLANCIPPELIIKTLLFELLKKLDQELKQV